MSVLFVNMHLDDAGTLLHSVYWTLFGVLEFCPFIRHRLLDCSRQCVSFALMM